MTATKGYRLINVIRTMSTLGCVVAIGWGIKSIFNIKTDLGNQPNTLVRSPGPNKDVVIIGSVPIHYPLIPRSDQRGNMMRNVAFGTFLRSKTPVTTTMTPNEATSFAVTPAGDGKYHIKVVAKNLAWTVQLPQSPPGQQYTLDSPVNVQPADGSQGQYWYLARVQDDAE
ncbi:hypothetical protein BD779DRAFT_1474913 [Infundibulicybe gibba]|nr:hypothetical protein BD779DRAFT_1474913 [Infundibulicybe gibba]